MVTTPLSMVYHYSVAWNGSPNTAPDTTPNTAPDPAVDREAAAERRLRG